ncbi:hypothetical protein CPC08DRAFT_707690 [Agrocybe pediades]|nr:hypothetical protein CPC08DRAFT_707690 [Agrocybe pediades]
MPWCTAQHHSGQRIPPKILEQRAVNVNRIQLLWKRQLSLQKPSPDKFSHHFSWSA